MNQMEIERKWLLEDFPPLPVLHSMRTEQGYLAFGPPISVRIRKREWDGGADYKLNCKGEGTLARAEVEMDISAGDYAALRRMLAGPPAIKDYRTYDLGGGLVLEASCVDPGQAGSFFYAEVEFASKEAAGRFVPPAFLGREVTHEAGHTMAAYCRRKAQGGA